MTWASWTTVGIHARPGTVHTVEGRDLNGDVTIHTTWSEKQADVTVQYTGSADWFTMVGSPVPCFSEEDSRSFHQAVVEAVRSGEDAERELQRLFERQQ
ncbi:hypothetical protein [Streptomyces sp. NPDC014733]|uniref:hypothetical protein n=1 Tax=Streptomyces sp. NPDC014733 TaxID=3364885 RepID=UPI0037017BCA